MPARLASYLLHHADEQNQDDVVVLKISKGQLASTLGTIPETLSRMFAKLSGQNLINVDGKKITLLDRRGLENLAEYILMPPAGGRWLIFTCRQFAAEQLDVTHFLFNDMIYAALS